MANLTLWKTTVRAVSALIISTLAWAQPLPSLPEDVLPQLDAQIQSALRVSPQLLVRQADAAASLADYDAAKSIRYPNLGGSLSYLRVEDDRSSLVGSRPGVQLTYYFAANVPLYHWGAVNRSIQSAKIRTLIDAGSTRKAYMTLVAEMRRQYLDLIRFKRGLLRARFGREMNQDALTEALQKREQNQNSEADVFQARLMKQRGDIAVAEAEDYLINASRTYARLTGLDVLSVDDIPAEFPIPTVGEDSGALAALLTSFLADEMPQNTDVLAAKQYLEIAENDLKNTRTSLRPKLGLTAGISQNDQDYAISADDYAYRQLFAGVTLSWSIFDGFATKARVKSSLARLRASEIRLAQQQQQLFDDATALRQDLSRMALAIDLAESELGSARNHLNFTQARQDRGEASVADVQLATLNLHDYIGAALYQRSLYWNRVSDLLVMVEADPTLNRIPASSE